MRVSLKATERTTINKYERKRGEERERKGKIIKIHKGLKKNNKRTFFKKTI